MGPDLVEGRPGPFAEIELEHILAIKDRQFEPGRQDLSHFPGSLQRAGIECRDPPAGQPLRDRGDFGAALIGKANPGRAPGEHPAGQNMLPMPQKMKDRHRDEPQSMTDRRRL